MKEVTKKGNKLRTNLTGVASERREILSPSQSFSGVIMKLRKKKQQGWEKFLAKPFQSRLASRDWKKESGACKEGNGSGQDPRKKQPTKVTVRDCQKDIIDAWGCQASRGVPDKEKARCERSLDEK